MARIPESNSDKTAIANIKCRKGDSFDRSLTFKTNGVEDDLTGCTFRMVVREVKPPNKTVLSFIMDDGASIVSNQLILSKSPTEMNAVNGGTYKYDIEQTYTNGTVRTRIEGAFIVNSDVS